MGPAAHLSRAAGIVLLVVGFAGSTLNLIGGLKESKRKSLNEQTEATQLEQPK
jgi:hypothetical protein